MGLQSRRFTKEVATSWSLPRLTSLQNEGNERYLELINCFYVILISKVPAGQALCSSQVHLSSVL
jgi:hypothetical protein